MSPRRQQLVLVLSIGILAGFAFAGSKLWRELRRPLTARLPDGSTLELMTWRIDRRCELRMAPSWGFWLDRFVPPRVRQGLPFGPQTTLASIESVNGGEALFLTLRHATGGVSSGYLWGRIRLADETGQTFDGVISSSGVGIGGDIHQMLQAPAFPRRGRELILTIEGWPRNNLTGPLVKLATFGLPNPERGTYPQWTATPLPQTHTNGNLVATLVSARTGAWWVEDPTFRNPGDLPGTSLQFRTSTLGGGTAWTPRSVEVSDATGNHWRPGTRPGLAGQVFLRDVLWPGEAAWKLRVEFVPAGGFGPGEMRTLSAIQLPPDNEAVHCNTPFEVNGCVVTFIDIAGSGTHLPLGDGLMTAAKDGKVHLKVRCPAVRFGKRFSFVRLTDELGREVKFSTGSEPDAVVSDYSLEVPIGAQSVIATVAMADSRFIEFLAQPVSAAATSK